MSTEEDYKTPLSDPIRRQVLALELLNEHPDGDWHYWYMNAIRTLLSQSTDEEKTKEEFVALSMRYAHGEQQRKEQGKRPFGPDPEWLPILEERHINGATELRFCGKPLEKDLPLRFSVQVDIYPDSNVYAIRKDPKVLYIVEQLHEVEGGSTLFWTDTTEAAVKKGIELLEAQGRSLEDTLEGCIGSLKEHGEVSMGGGIFLLRAERVP